MKLTAEMIQHVIWKHAAPDGISAIELTKAAAEILELHEVAALADDRWQDISTAPRDTDIDTYGELRAKPGGELIKHLRLADDFISANTVNPITKTNVLMDGYHGNYVRTHWRPVPPAPRTTEVG